jgi:signal transduction histidine kinase
MIFASALRRLTVVYTVIQLVLFGAVAIGIYLFVTGTFDLDVATQDGAAAVNAAELGFAHLRIALLVGFGILCVVVPFTSYWMAKAALAPLRRSIEQQQRFVDDASHELRSPLTVIRGELELALSRPRSGEEYRQSIVTTLEATQTLVQFTEDLLLLARDAPAELRSRFVPVPVDSVVREAVRAAGAGTHHERVTVRPGPSVAVDGVPALLVRALSNLLDNAMKFTPPGGTITVSLTAGPHSVTVSVADTGVGMSPEEVEHAFDRFWRGPDAHSSSGHGLGLSVVERIVHAHRGRVRITSTPGLGSRVDLVLPISPQK